MINRDHFYSIVRLSLYRGTIGPVAFSGLEALLDYWERETIPGYPPLKERNLCWLAYILATVFHETDRTFQPIEEYGKGSGKSYRQKLKYGKGPGKRIPYTKPDKLYYGRGHTQNTWYEIYENLTKAAVKQGHSWDFLNNPELLLQMEPSLWATFYAMNTGLYTGRKLSDYFTDSKTDWVNARKVINGLDKAEIIASYGKMFYLALTPKLPETKRPA